MIVRGVGERVAQSLLEQVRQLLREIEKVEEELMNSANASLRTEDTHLSSVLPSFRLGRGQLFA